MSRAKNVAILIAVAIAAFYAGSLAEFQVGAYAPTWVKSLLFYTPPKTDLDYGALGEVCVATATTSSSFTPAGSTRSTGTFPDTPWPMAPRSTKTP